MIRSFVHAHSETPLSSAREPAPIILTRQSLAFSGAVYAIFRPERYGADLLPEGVERVTKIIGETTRGQMIIGGLGSCFLLLTMISLSLFYMMKKHLEPYPAIQEKLVRALLVPLAIADLTHIFLTLLPFPMSLLKSPSRWTYVTNSNVWITVGLFLVRMAWLFGIGRTRINTLNDGRARSVPPAKQTNPKPRTPSPAASAQKQRVSPPVSEAGSVETTRTTRSTRGKSRGGRRTAAAAELEEIGLQVSTQAST